MEKILEKEQVLMKIYCLQRQGVDFTKQYTREDSLEQMTYELECIQKQQEKEKMFAFMIHQQPKEERMKQEIILLLCLQKNNFPPELCQKIIFKTRCTKLEPDVTKKLCGIFARVLFASINFM